MTDILRLHSDLPPVAGYYQRLQQVKSHMIDVVVGGDKVHYTDWQDTTFFL